jgi:hypothetical protein
LIRVGSKLFLYSYALSNCAYRCYKVFWYSFLSSMNCSLSTFVVFLLSSLNYNRDTFFIFINSKSIKTFSFSFFSLINVFTRLSKTSYSFLWRNSAYVHFMSMVSHISPFCFKLCNFSSYDFNHDVLPLSSSFSSYSFLMSTIFLCSASTLFFL